MQVILLEKIGKLGNLGDIVDIKRGYARNYLIPTGKAKKATKENIHDFEQMKSKLEAKQKAILDEALAKKALIEQKEFVIKQKSGIDGRLFGSVTTMDIVQILKDNNIIILKSSVRLPNGPLKNVGKYEIFVALHHDAIAKVKLQVLPLSE